MEKPETDPSQNAGTPEGTAGVEVRESLRCQAVFLRQPDEIGAMGGIARLRKKVKHGFRKICCMGPSAPQKKDDENWDAEANVDSTKPQYRLEATRVKKKRKWYSCCRSKGPLGAPSGVGLTPNQSLAVYLHWLFRVNFFFLFFLSCVVFFALVIFFSGLITIAGEMDPQCVRIGGDEFNSVGAAFADAFALSWTTFSTVGYGSTYPALSHENVNKSNCLFITIITSLESFVGVLYSGFCGAILFGKVLRIQSHAQVMFSDPIVIRYGKGVEVPEDDDDDDDVDDDDERLAVMPSVKDSESARIQCPVLEFRIVNRLFNEAGGEIMDAALNVVANVDANDADPSESVIPFLERSEHMHENSGADIPLQQFTARVSGRSFSRQQSWRFMSGSSFPPFRRSEHHTIEEDPTARIVSKVIFSKLHIEATDHPFFKRVWLVRHELDDSSPILTPQARRAIRKNGGFWPKQLNSYEGVRASLNFNQILVSLNGVSNVSASDVYAQKIYDFVDVNIGYQFVNLLYKDGDELRVDTDLINDVREQNGGGGEPLTLDDQFLA